MPAYRGYQIEYVTHGEAVIAVIRDGGGRVVHRSQGAAGTRRTQAQAGEAARRWVKYHEGRGRPRPRLGEADLSAEERRELERRRVAARAQRRDRMGRFG
ncbi:MAG: hypothetical protein ABSH07_12010 [Candidatus Dormibacteria bacterium]|jgi:IMP dehydrogenase/GMP reductase